MTGTTALACDAGATLTAQEGVILSPVGEDGNNYPDNADCVWNIQVSTAVLVKIDQK